MQRLDLKEILSNRSKIIAFSAPLLIIIYLIFLIRPKIQEFFTTLPQVSQLKSKVINVERSWANIDSFKEKILHSKEKLGYYEKRLPGEKELPALLQFLSDSAKELDVRIIEIEPGEPDKTAQSPIYYQVPISLRAECGYHQLGRFLNRLESADRFMKISDIKIKANPDRVDSHFVQLDIVTYVLKK